MRRRASRTCRDGLPVSPSAAFMYEEKDTKRSRVRVSFDGRVIKTYRGPDARERFDQEVKVLKLLEKRGCGFVPRLLSADPEQVEIVTSNCGQKVELLSDRKKRQLFAELEQYGVRHDDAEKRNVTYRRQDGRFCIIDFELATILDEDPGDDS